MANFPTPFPTHPRYFSQIVGKGRGKRGKTCQPPLPFIIFANGKAKRLGCDKEMMAT